MHAGGGGGGDSKAGGAGGLQGGMYKPDPEEMEACNARVVAVVAELDAFRARVRRRQTRRAFVAHRAASGRVRRWWRAARAARAAAVAHAAAAAAALVVQRTARGAAGRHRAVRRKAAVALVQRAGRTSIARRAYSRLLRALVALQALRRRNTAAAAYLRVRGAAVRVQALVVGALCRLAAARDRKAEMAALREAVAKGWAANATSLLFRSAWWLGNAGHGYVDLRLARDEAARLEAEARGGGKRAREAALAAEREAMYKALQRETAENAPLFAAFAIEGKFRKRRLAKAVWAQRAQDGDSAVVGAALLGRMPEAHRRDVAREGREAVVKAACAAVARALLVG